MYLTKLAKQAGVPDGVLNVIHGAVDAVNFICDEPRIRAISFVGSDTAGTHIYQRGNTSALCAILSVGVNESWPL